MKNKIVLTNLLILLIYTTAIVSSSYSSNNSERGLAVAIYMGIFLGGHIFINFVTSIIYFTNKNKIKGKQFLLSGLLILLIGFPACWLGASI
jgi:hypothetical protein